MNEIDVIQRKLGELESRLRDVSRGLEQIATDSERKTIDRLEMAMSEVNEIAVCVRGDYEPHDREDDQMSNPVHKAVEYFQEMEEKAEAGLQYISIFHDQVTGIRNSELASINGRIGFAFEQDLNQLNSIQKQLRTAEQNSLNLERGVKDQMDVVNNLQSRMEDAQAEANARDMNFNFDFGNFMNDRRPLELSNLKEDFELARHMLQEVTRNRNFAVAEFDRLRNLRTDLERRVNSGRQIQDVLPGLQLAANESESRCIELQSRFIAVNDTASKLSMMAQQVQDGSTMLKKKVITKKEFVQLLLEMCKNALIDPRLADQVQKIKEEVIVGYGKSVPDEIAKIGYEVDEKLKTLRQ